MHCFKSVTEKQEIFLTLTNCFVTPTLAPFFYTKRHTVHTALGLFLYDVTKGTDSFTQPLIDTTPWGILLYTYVCNDNKVSQVKSKFVNASSWEIDF